MISRETYTVLKVIPNYPDKKELANMKGVEPTPLTDQVLSTADNNGLINVKLGKSGSILDPESTFWLTEKGSTEVQEYQRILENQNMLMQSNKNAKIAMIAAIASAVAAFLSFVKQIA